MHEHVNDSKLLGHDLQEFPRHQAESPLDSLPGEVSFGGCLLFPLAISVGQTLSESPMHPLLADRMSSSMLLIPSEAAVIESI